MSVVLTVFIQMKNECGSDCFYSNIKARPSSFTFTFLMFLGLPLSYVVGLCFLFVLFFMLVLCPFLLCL